MNKQFNEMTEIFGEVIYSYTRKQAIEDGVLVSLSDLFPEHCRQLYKYPVAVTSAVWSTVEAAGKKDPQGIIWDILWMSQRGITKRIDPTQHLFKVIINGPGETEFSRIKTHTFKVMCHPGDEAEPVITIMLPDED